MEGLHSRVREFVRTRYLEPARNRGASELSLRAGDVHAAMGLEARMPAICDVLGSMIFLEENRLALVGRRGPKHGANVFFTYRLTENASRNEAPRMNVH